MIPQLEFGVKLKLADSRVSKTYAIENMLYVTFIILDTIGLVMFFFFFLFFFFFFFLIFFLKNINIFFKNKMFFI